MPEGIIEIKEWLSGNLNPSIFSWDSAEGVVVTILCAIIIYRLTKNLGRFIGWCIGALTLIQFGHLMGFTVLNNYFPFRDLFKYDILASAAQLVAGTWVSDALLYLDAMFQYGAKVVSEFLVELFPFARVISERFFESAPWGQ